MDSKNIKSILQDALEEEVPASEINLLPAIQSRLVAGKKYSTQQGEKMNKAPIKRLAFAVLTVAALTLISLATPQGRAFAQSILQFFTHAESDTFKLQPTKIIPIETTQAGATAVPPSRLINITGADALLGFDVLELPSIPDGFNYLFARLYENSISIEYEAQGGGGNLIIKQFRDGYNQSEWDQVPADAIIPVKIGELDGEFAQGSFIVYPNATSATWNPNLAILRLRWIRDGIWFEITKYGDVERIEYLDQSGMIELAESLQ